MPEVKGFNVTKVASICHEANRQYCKTLGDESQPPWGEAPEWQVMSAVDGVIFHLETLLAGGKPDPAQSHNSWMAQKAAEGWKYGPVKNPETKEHPCFVPYEELPKEQKAKDYLFCAIVEAFYEVARLS